MAIHNDTFANVDNWDACNTNENFNNGESGQISATTYDSRSAIQINEPGTGTGATMVYNVATGFEYLQSGTIEMIFNSRFGSPSNYSVIGFFMGASWDGANIDSVAFVFNVKTAKINISNTFGLTMQNSGDNTWTDCHSDLNDWWKAVLTFSASGSDHNMNLKVYNPSSVLKDDIDCDLTNSVGVIGTRYGMYVPYRSDSVFSYVDQYNVDGTFGGGGGGIITPSKVIMVI